MARERKTAPAPAAQAHVPAPAGEELTPLEKARLARKAQGSRLPAEELGVTNRLIQLRELERELTPAEQTEKTQLASKKKQMAFSRLATKYTKEAVKQIGNIRGLAASNYVSSPAQVERIQNLLSDAVAECISAFGKTSAGPTDDIVI